MEKEAKGGTPNNHTISQNKEKHDEKPNTMINVGKKRPRRSTSSYSPNKSPTAKEMNDIDDTTIDYDCYDTSKMAAASPGTTSTSANTTANTTNTTTNQGAVPEEQQQQQQLHQSIQTSENDCNNSNDPNYSNSKDVAAMGVSLPWFEKGGPLHKRPRSLLWDKTATTTFEHRNNGNDTSNSNSSHRTYGKRTRAEQDIDATATSSSRGSTQKIHFCGLPIPSKLVGVCAECGIGEDEGEGGADSGISGGDNNPEGGNSNGIANGNGNVVVLCDGPGCNREFHLKCCKPPLQQVPEDEEYYCFDCHPNGGYATTLLEEYLDETEEHREVHNEENQQQDLLLLLEAASSSSAGHPTANGVDTASTTGKAPSSGPKTPTRRTRRIPQSSKKDHEKDETAPTTNTNGNGNASNNISSDNTNGKTRWKSGVVSSKLAFVDKLIFEDMKENQPELLSQLMNGICSDAIEKGPPRSELEVFHRSNSSSSNNINNELLLVGCAIRLYCPKTNHYHTGRVLRIREPPHNRDPNDVIGEDYDRNFDTECLVRFQAGRDHRKKSLTRWIRLEEHSLAVACPHLVWGKFYGNELDDSTAAETTASSSSSKKGNGKKKRKSSSSPNSSSSQDRWVPTKLWMRSSRELVISMQLLDESLGQISYRDFRNFASSLALTLTSATTTPTTSLATTPLGGKRMQRSSLHRNGIQLFETEKLAATNSANNGASKAKSYLQQEWILAECIGRGIYKLVHVPTETREYSGGDSSDAALAAALKTAKNPGKNGGSSNKRSSSSSTRRSTQTGTRPRENEIMMALVQAEREERNRVELWNKLPLQNAWHEKALTCLDEFALGPLSYDTAYHQTDVYGSCSDACEARMEVDNDDEAENEKNESYTNTISIQPTPLVRTGLDRIYILERFVKHFNDQLEVSGDGNSYGDHSFRLGSNNGLLQGTKDLVMSLSSELVTNHSITACIQQQNRTSRLRHDQQMTLAQQQQQQQQAVGNQPERSEGSTPPPIPVPLSDTTEENRNSATQGGETTKCVQLLNDGEATNGKNCAEETPTDIKPETKPETVKTVVPIEASRSAVVAQKTLPLSQSPTSSKIIPLLVGNETKTEANEMRNEAIHVPSSRGLETTPAASHTEAGGTTTTTSTAITPSVPGPEILLSNESTSTVPTSVPTPS